jgi:hypothetical protein
MANSILETYQPFPRQAEFHRSRAKYRLFGGAAGPGKTAALVWEAVMQSLETPACSCLLVRRTFPELEMSLLKEFHKSVPWRAMGARYNDAKHRVLWPNGSELRFGFCTNENDVYQYQGAEFLFIGLDELTHFTLKQWQYLSSRNRHPGKFARMAGATNPGNIGHAWVKALWIDKKPAPGMDEPEKYNPDDYEFVRALVSDNPIYANDKNYLATLDSLGKDLRRALLEGLWDQFAGQYFDNFDYARHVGRWHGDELVDPGTLDDDKPLSYKISPWQEPWISIDWGYKDDAAIHWHLTAPDGRHLTYREWVVNGVTPRMLAEGIAERSVHRDGRQEKISQVFIGKDAFQDRTGQSTIAQQLMDVMCRGNRFPQLAAASDDRVGGWMLLYQLLEAREWLIAENCEVLISSLPTLTRDEKKVEDCKPSNVDHAPDSARYGLYSRLGARQAPIKIRIAEQVAAIPLINGNPNYTQIALVHQRMEADERRRNQPVAIPSRFGSGGRRRWRPGG